MQCYQGEYQRLKILDEVVKDTQTFRVLRFCNIDERANLGSLSKSVSKGAPGGRDLSNSHLEGNMLATHPNLQLLSAILILLWPFTVVFPVQL